MSKPRAPVNARVAASHGALESISVCLIVRNEEQLIGHCLSSVAAIADEFVVVDTGSTDRTRAIARGLGARVIRHRWRNYADARNAYIQAARSRWILVLDADESIAAADLAAIRRLVRRQSAVGYRLLVRNYTDGYDLLWRWSPNDGSYARQERFSRCAGWMRTDALRLFRNLEDVRYPAVLSAHPTVFDSLRRYGHVDDRDDVVVHHFQYLKGGARFLAGKQRRRLSDEMRRIRQGPYDSGTYLNAAKTLFSEGRDQEAARLLSTMLRRDSALHDAHLLWSMIEFENLRFREAERRARQAIAANGASADAWCLAGMALIEDGRPSEALPALERALDLHPRHLFAHNSLGLALNAIGRVAEARQAVRAAIRLHPRFEPARANLARIRRSPSGARRAR